MAVTNFITNFVCADGKYYLAERENYLADSKNSLAESKIILLTARAFRDASTRHLCWVGSTNYTLLILLNIKQLSRLVLGMYSF